MHTCVDVAAIGEPAGEAMDQVIGNTATALVTDAIITAGVTKDAGVGRTLDHAGPVAGS